MIVEIFDISTIPCLPSKKVLEKHTIGQLYDLSQTDEINRNAVCAFIDSSVYSRDVCYSIVFAKDFAEILFQKTDSQRAMFSWKFIPNDHFETGVTRESKRDEDWYGDGGPDRVFPAVRFLLKLQEVFKAPLRDIVIDAAMFENRFISSELTQCITKLQSCNTLYVSSTKEAPAAIHYILSNISTEHVIVRDLVDRTVYSSEKFMRIPKREFHVKSIEPRELLKLSRSDTTLTVHSISADQLTDFLELWMRGNTRHIQRLALNTNIQNSSIWEAFFINLRYKFGAFPISTFHYGNSCTNPNCHRRKNSILKEIGVELRRSDGIIASVFYTAKCSQFNFSMFVVYPEDDLRSILEWDYDLSKAYSDAINFEEFILAHGSLKRDIEKNSNRGLFEFNPERLRRAQREMAVFEGSRVYYFYRLYYLTKVLETIRQFDVRYARNQYEKAMEELLPNSFLVCMDPLFGPIPLGNRMGEDEQGGQEAMKNN